MLEDPTGSTVLGTNVATAVATAPPTGQPLAPELGLLARLLPPLAQAQTNLSVLSKLLRLARPLAPCNPAETAAMQHQLTPITLAALPSATLLLGVWKTGQHAMSHAEVSHPGDFSSLPDHLMEQAALLMISIRSEGSASFLDLGLCRSQDLALK